MSDIHKSALLIVDVQNDFCPGGALAVARGDEVVPVLNAEIERFGAAGRPIVASRDWHPGETIHFVGGGGPWPPHCVAGQPGAAFHADLRLPPDAVVVSKGTGATEDAYSAFDARAADGRPLDQVLRDAGVTELVVGGLATDYCVRASALDAVARGYRVTLLQQAVRGVDVHPGDSTRALADMRAAGVTIA